MGSERGWFVGPFHEKYDSHHTWQIGGGWGNSIGFNGEELRERQVRRWKWLPFRKTEHYRLIYGFGKLPRVGDHLESRIGLHRITRVEVCRDPDDMWTGEADVVPTGVIRDGK